MLTWLLLSVILGSANSITGFVTIADDGNVIRRLIERNLPYRRDGRAVWRRCAVK